MSARRTVCNFEATLVRPANRAGEPNELAYPLSVCLTFPMTPARDLAAERRVPSAFLRARSGGVKQATFVGCLSYSKGAGFIAGSLRLGSRILSATARFRASTQGEAQVTPGAGFRVVATSDRVRGLIRREFGVLDMGPGQGGDPPVAAKHVRQSLLAVQ